VDSILELFSFEGRANRAWYFWHQLLDWFVIVALLTVLIAVGVAAGNMAIILPAMGVVVGGMVAGLAVTVKRLHDIGRPGWHAVGLLVPLYNIYLGLVLLLKRGDQGSNRFGVDPLQYNVHRDYLEG